MARTTLANVRALLSGQEIDIDDVDLFSFISTANTYVTDNLSDSGLTAALLIEIEKYLAAHFASLRDVSAGVSSQRSDDQSITYTVGQVTNTDFLQSTHFGQVAVSLDVSGTLANAGRAKAVLEVL